jgi:glycosyltransferase involved in cell wall biosynthesis
MPAAEQPLLSIGVPTYRRHAMLRECLTSILAQGFADLEILVGNDYTGEVVTGELIGVTDARVQYINYPENLGARRNHDTLLRLAKGRYFTWLADDDLHAPIFLESVLGAFRTFHDVACVYTAYAIGESYDAPTVANGPGDLLDGGEFLRRYLRGRVRVVGCYGVFDRQRLLDLGGFQQFGDGFSPYSDNLLAVRAARLDRIVYIDSPLVFARAHNGSASWTSGDLVVYRRAQEYWCRHSLEVFAEDALKPDLEDNLHLMLRWCIRDFTAVGVRADEVRPAEAARFLRFVNEYASRLKPASRAHVVGSAVRALARVWMTRRRERLQRAS